MSLAFPVRVANQSVWPRYHTYISLSVLIVSVHCPFHCSLFALHCSIHCLLVGIVSVTMKTVRHTWILMKTRSRKETHGTVGWIPVKTAVSA
jgi:hypothetical protein